MDLGRELRKAVRERNFGNIDNVYIERPEDSTVKSEVEVRNAVKKFLDKIREIMGRNENVGDFSFDQVECSEDVVDGFFVIKLQKNVVISGENDEDSDESDFPDEETVTRSQNHSFVCVTTGNVFLPDPVDNFMPLQMLGIRGNVFNEDKYEIILKSDGRLRNFSGSVVEVLHLFSDSYRSVVSKDPLGNTALIIAASEANQQFMNYVVDNFLDIYKENNENIFGIKNKSGATVLMKLCENKSEEHYKLLKQLLEHPNVELLINEANNWGLTALHLACIVGNYAAVDLLLKFKADVKVRDAKGLRPEFYARKENFFQAVGSDESFDSRIGTLLLSHS